MSAVRKVTPVTPKAEAASAAAIDNALTPIRSSWQPVADASDEIAELVTEIPGWNGHRHSIESQAELRRAAELLAQAIPLLKRVSEREGGATCD